MSEPIVRQLGDFIDADIEREEKVLDPWLPANGIAMVAGERGLGKTMFTVAVAIAIAGAGSVLGWHSPEPRGVLYVDGEMALTEMQDRARGLLAGSDCDKEQAMQNLFFLCDADQPNGIKNLIEHSASRHMVEDIMEAHDLRVLILDNLSALCNSADENDAESWTIMQDWLRSLRRKGYTIIFLHHTTKPNDKGYVHQRGTSKREDIINTSILLVRAKGRKDGFRVIFTKNRGFAPDGEVDVTLVITPEKYQVITSLEAEGVTKIAMGKFKRELG